MEALTSFGISLAAGIALDIYNKSKGTVKNEIKKAFNSALVIWCPNTDIRRHKKNAINKGITRLIGEPELIADIENQNAELHSFYKIFNKELAQHSAAYNYIKDIKDLERYRNETKILLSIKDTVDDISKKLAKLIEDNLPKNNGVLELEWKRQLSVYKESISKFKPKTALELLNKLEDSFSQNNIRPSKNILASIEFLKGQCYEFLAQEMEMHQSYIKAAQLNNTVMQFKEKACYAYAKIGEREKAAYLINEIISYDEYNSIAWVVKIILDDSNRLEQQLINTPSIVKNDWNFKRLIYFNVLKRGDFYDKIDILNSHKLLDVEYEETTFSLTSYKKALFAIELSLSRLFSSSYFDPTSIKPNDLAPVERANRMLKHFLSEMSNTEIIFNYESIKFYYNYTEFVLTENREFVFKMKESFFEMKEVPKTLVMTLANSLQLINEIDDALSILEQQKTKSFDFLQLEAFCFLKKSEFNNYLQSFKKLLSLITTINVIEAEGILSMIVILYQNNKIDEIDLSDFIEKKEFELDDLKTLISTVFQILKKRDIDENIIKLSSIEERVLQLNSGIKFYIPYSYFTVKMWDSAIITFRKYISFNSQSRDLYYYILSLDRSLSNHDELLQLLSTWRQKFSFEDELLRIESDIYRQLADWNMCFVISQKYLSKHPNNESFLVLKLMSLNEIEFEGKELQIEELAHIFNDFEFQFPFHAQQVCMILIENNLYQIALDILFEIAVDPGNIQARMSYFFATIQMPKDFLNEYDIIDQNSYVKYSLNKETKFQKIEKGNALSEKLLGCKVGDIVKIERPFVNTIDSIKVLRIMDKYLSLHDQILEDVKSNPYGGFPMQSFEFKDTSPEGMTKTFIELFGAEETAKKLKSEEVLRKYYSYDLSLKEVIIQLYNSNYLVGYFDLIRKREGIIQIPKQFYPSNIEINNVEIVIDFSSLVILHQISRKHNVVFDQKFLIAKGTVDNIKSFLKKEKSEPDERVALNVSLEKVTLDSISKEVTIGNITFLEQLLEWVGLHCTEELVVSKLDIIRKIDHKTNRNEYLNLLVENVSLVLEGENRILLTDDSVYFKFFPIQSAKTISSEFFMKTVMSIDSESLVEFVHNKYIGYTYNSVLIEQEFQKKESGQFNNYVHCINNTTLSLIPSKDTIQTMIKFLKQIALNPNLTLETFRLEATNALVSLLKGQVEESPFKLTELIIRNEFNLMGTKLDLILASYNDALVILSRVKSREVRS